MNCRFHFQDPTSADTVYLCEAILEASKGASSCEGVFAFASRAGVDALLEDPQAQSFLEASSMSLLIGIDAVTTRDALVRLKEFESSYQRLSVQVFWNPTNALFHPKVARFEYLDGSKLMIVGSGNLTPGGLRQNFEAFGVMRVDPGEEFDSSTWDRFMARHASDLRKIDDEVLQRADSNARIGAKTGNFDGQTVGSSVTTSGRSTVDMSIYSEDRVLVAEVPRAGSRWHQIHFNLDVVREFFRVRPNSSQRVYLMECYPDGTASEQEVRPCVYSDANKNAKIEVAARPGESYPDTGRPIGVFRELQARVFAYMLLLPGDAGYEQMLAMLVERPSLGRGVRRVIAHLRDIEGKWPTSPLLSSPQNTEQILTT